VAVDRALGQILVVYQCNNSILVADDDLTGHSNDHSIDQSTKQSFICLKLNKKQLKIHVCTVIRGSAIAEKAPWIQLQLSPLPVSQKVFISSKSSFFTAFA